MTMGDDDLRGVANLDPQGHDWQDFIEYHLTLLHTKYPSFRPCGFYRRIFLNIFPIISLCHIMMPTWRGQFGPQGHDWQEL